MPLDWQRIEEAKTTEASLWRLVDELHNNSPDATDLARIERLLKFGNLPQKVYQCVDDALKKSQRSTQRIEPIWKATLNTREHQALRETIFDEEFVSAHDFKSPTAVAPPDAYPIKMDEDMTKERSMPDKESLAPQPITQPMMEVLEETKESEVLEDTAESTVPTEETKPIRDPSLVITAPIEIVQRDSPVLSGIFSRPKEEVHDLMPNGPYELKYLDTIYSSVSKETLLHLFRRGVLLAAYISVDGRWIPVTTHPDFADVRRVVAQEIDRIVAKSDSEVTRPNGGIVVPDDIDDEERTEVLELASRDATNVVEHNGFSEDIEERTNIFEQELFEELDIDDSAVFMHEDEPPTMQFEHNSNSDSWPFSGIFEEIDEIILGPEIRSYSDIPALKAEAAEEGTQADTPMAKGMLPDAETNEHFPLPPSVRLRESQIVPVEVRPAAAAEMTAEIVRNPEPEPSGPKILRDIEAAEREAKKLKGRKDTQPIMNVPVPKLVRRRRKRRSTIPLAAGLAALVLTAGLAAVETGLIDLGVAPKPVKEITVQKIDPMVTAVGAASTQLGIATMVPTDDPGLQRRVSQDLFLAGDHEQAIKIAGVAQSNHPTAEDALTLAEWQLKSGKFEQARKTAFAARKLGADLSAAETIFLESVRQDPELKQEAQRLDLNSIADAATDERSGRVSVRLTLAEKSVAVLEFAQRGDRARADRFVAATRLCTMLDCKFDLPKAKPVLIEREQLTTMLGKRKAKRLRRLAWKKDRVTQKQYVSAALIDADDAKQTQFPIEATAVWDSWLNPKRAADLDKRIATFLLPWDRLDPDLRIQFTEHVGTTTTREIAHQISSMLLFDTLTHNADRFEKKRRDWGETVSLANGKLRSLSHNSVFPTKRPRRLSKAYKKLDRYNGYELFALSSLKPDVVAQILFPDPTKADKKRADLFWDARNEVLVKANSTKNSVFADAPASKNQL